MKVQQEPAAVNFHFSTGREVPSNDKAYLQAVFFLMHLSDSDKLGFFFSIFTGLSSRLLSWPQLNPKVVKRFNDWMTAIQKDFLNIESLCSWNHFSWFPGCWIYTMSQRVTIVSESCYKYSVITNTFWTKIAICVLSFFLWERDKKLISTNPHSVSHESQKHTSCTSTASWIALLIVPIFYMHFFFGRSQRITLSDLSDNLQIPMLVAFCHACVNMSWVLD